MTKTTAWFVIAGVVLLGVIAYTFFAPAVGVRVVDTKHVYVDSPEGGVNLWPVECRSKCTASQFYACTDEKGVDISFVNDWTTLLVMESAPISNCGEKYLSVHYEGHRYLVRQDYTRQTHKIEYIDLQTRIRRTLNIAIPAVIVMVVAVGLFHFRDWIEMKLNITHSRGGD